MPAESIRLLDVGLVPPAFSQSIYHAVAHEMGERSPDTVILVSPSDPYVCIGVHQELEAEVDVGYCRECGLPVFRREVGGGAVYLDRHQLFVQWIFRAGSLPARVDEQFQLYAKLLVAAYHDLGIDAYFRPANDVHVAGKKIGGIGAARIGKANVVVGSFMFDFDKASMARVLKVASEKMRDKVVEALAQYMTTMRELLPELPSRQEVVASYVDHCEETFCRPLVSGDLTSAEVSKAKELECLFASEEWLREKGALRRSHVKIHEDVRVSEAVHKAPGGLIRVTARVRSGVVDDVEVSGDFTMIPATGLPAVEAALRGCALERRPLEHAVCGAYEAACIESPGVTPADVASALLQLGA